LANATVSRSVPPGLYRTSSPAPGSGSRCPDNPALSGRPELGIEPVDRAIRLNPRFVNGPYLNMRCVIKAIAQEYDGAVQSFEENIARHGPVGPPVLSYAATAYWALGKRDNAERAVAQLATRFPDFRLKNWNFFKLIQSPEERRRIHDLMRAAGVPE
jgi:tetratricopeptide (TPR) repeat protein